MGSSISDTMLDFKQPFGSSFFFSTDRETSIYCNEKPLGLFSTVEASSSVKPDLPCHGLLSNAEKDNIEEHVGGQYLRCWKDDLFRIRATLAEKTWFGFDLDDTLHDFRRASGTATTRVLEDISQQERTVQSLGLSAYIDFLATTNQFRVTNTNGLFPRVLGYLGISPGDMVYVGDNEQRDMEPAMAEGIFSIHLAEAKHVSLDDSPPRVNTLRKLQYIFSDEHPEFPATSM